MTDDDIDHWAEQVAVTSQRCNYSKDVCVSYLSRALFFASTLGMLAEVESFMGNGRKSRNLVVIKLWNKANMCGDA